MHARFGLTLLLFAVGACHGGEKRGGFPDSDEVLLGYWQGDAAACVRFEHAMLWTSESFCDQASCGWERQAPELIVVLTAEGSETVQVEIADSSLALSLWQSDQLVSSEFLRSDGGGCL